MIKRKEFYKDFRIRFITFSENKELLINTDDICKVLGISNQKRQQDGLLTLPSLDKTAALQAAHTASEEDIDLAQWILETFADFNNETSWEKWIINPWDFE